MPEPDREAIFDATLDLMRVVAGAIEDLRAEMRALDDGQLYRHEQTVQQIRSALRCGIGETYAALVAADPSCIDKVALIMRSFS